MSGWPTRAGMQSLAPSMPRWKSQARKCSAVSERYGNEGTLGMDVMDMFNDMPLVSVLLFQQGALAQPAEEIVDGMLKQAHSMSLG